MDLVLGVLGFIVVVALLVAWMRRGDSPTRRTSHSCDDALLTYIVVDSVVDSIVDSLTDD